MSPDNRVFVVSRALGTDTTVFEYDDSGAEVWCSVVESLVRLPVAVETGDLYFEANEEVCRLNEQGGETGCIEFEDYPDYLTVDDDGTAYILFRPTAVGSWMDDDDSYEICRMDWQGVYDCFDTETGRVVNNFIVDGDGNFYVAYTGTTSQGNPCKYDSDGERIWCVTDDEFNLVHYAMTVTDVNDANEPLALFSSNAGVDPRLPIKFDRQGQMETFGGGEFETVICAE